MRYVGILVVVFAMAACTSNSSSSDKPPTTRPTTTRLTAVPKVPGAPNNRHLARAGLIRSTDLPGFLSTPVSSAAGLTDLGEGSQGIPACEKFRRKRNGDAVEQSPQYTKDATTVDDFVGVFADAPIVAAEFDLYRDPTFVTCLQLQVTKRLNDTMPATASIGHVDVSPIAIANLGNRQFGFRIMSSVTDDTGKVHTLLFDIVRVAVGRAAINFNPRGPAADMTALESRLIPVLVGRLRRAGAETTK